MDALSDRFEEFLVYRSTAKLSEHTVKAYRQDFAAIASRLATTAGTTTDQLGCDVIDKTRMRGAFADFAAGPLGRVDPAVLVDMEQPVSRASVPAGPGTTIAPPRCAVGRSEYSRGDPGSGDQRASSSTSM